MGEIMKKSEFKKILNKENESVKKYSIYSGVIILLYIIMLGVILYLQFINVIPSSVSFIIAAIMIVCAVIPSIIIDAKNESEIKKLYNHYQKENKMLEYKDKTKYLRIIIIIEILLALIFSIYIIPNYILKNDSDMSEIVNTLTITTNVGNVIKTEYQDLGDFSIKIPKDFKIMKDEVVAVKYPSQNPPSLVYTNEEGNINIAFNLNDVSMKESEIEEYVKMMEKSYLQIVDEVDVNFFERNGHQIGVLKFVSPASDTDIYNHSLVFSVDGKLRVINFNCTEKYMEEWKEVGEFIATSIIFE